MKKIILVLTLVMTINTCLAWTLMPNNVVSASLTQSREYWASNTCLKDRRKYFCGGQKCDNFREMQFKNFCWNYYLITQKCAYQRKTMQEYTVIPVNEQYKKNYFEQQQINQIDEEQNKIEESSDNNYYCEICKDAARFKDFVKDEDNAGKQGWVNYCNKECK